MKTKLFIILTLTLLMLTAATSVFAQRRRVVVVHRVYHGGLFYGPRFSGFYPVYYRPGQRYASIDFNVEPQDAIIYIDGAKLGKVDDYNGYPGTAHVTPGKHKVTIKTKDGQKYTIELYAQPGKEIDFNYKFEGY